MTRVVDASVVVAGLVDSGADGEWAAPILASGVLVAPQLMHAEAANILRRASLAGEISVDRATEAYGYLLDLRVLLYPFEAFAERIWELRNALTIYDAWYVAMAEHLDVELATLDRRLSRAPGPECRFLLPGPGAEE